MGIIAIVGRPNVGKSSIFNRLVRRRAAIVDDLPGITRDRLYGEVEWNGYHFYAVDTGGVMGEEDSRFPEINARILSQVELALAESDAVVFVLDGRDGPTAMDEELALMLRRSGCRVFVAVNKIDNPAKAETAFDAFVLGFEDVFAVSAEHNWGIDELLDKVVTFLPEQGDFEEAEDIPVTLIGRPNVGKSSLLNALAGEERSLVSDVPGTTRDVVDSIVEAEGARYRFLDTAGLRRKARVRSNVEYYSGVRAFQAIDDCRVAVVLLDATELVTDQDKRLISHVLERGKGLVIVVNKWDLTPREEKIGDKMRKLLKQELPFASHAPVLFMSAKTGRGVNRLFQHLRRADENRRRRVSTNELNRLLRDVLAFERMPGDGRGRYLKISFCTQADGTPPAFVFFVNDDRMVTRPFSRRLENIIRGMADFTGSPIRIFFRNKQERSI